MRFAGKGRGKSGGYRVITFYAGTNLPVFLLNIFSKNEKTNLTHNERAVLKTVLASLANEYNSNKELQ